MKGNYNFVWILGAKKADMKNKFEAAQSLRRILGENGNNWNSEAVTKWISDNFDRFPNINWQQTVANNGKNFKIEEILPKKFLAHELHTSLAENEHNWSAEPVQKWIQTHGPLFPNVDWPSVTQNNGQGFNWGSTFGFRHSNMIIIAFIA